MLAILGGLGAAVAWAATTLAASRASRLIDVRSLLASVMLIGLLVAAPAAVIAGVPRALDAQSLGWMAVSGAGNVVGLLCTYAALQIGKVGLVAPITSTEGAVAAVLAVLLGEKLAPGSGVTLAAIAVGVSLAAVSRGGEEERRSDLRAILFAVGAALSFGRVGKDLGTAWAVLPPRVVGVVAIAIPLALTRRWRMRRAALPYVVVAGLCEVLGFASYAVGAQHGLAVSAVLASQFAAIAAVVGYLAFHERLGPIQVTGIVTIVAGVTVLSALQA
jgi:drug/metabolite transporter (DMT)-like permease